MVETNRASPVVAILAILALALGLLVPVPAVAQLESFQPWIDYIAEKSTRRWEGQRVDRPDPTPRPDLPLRARSLLRPLSVHAGPAVSDRQVEVALRAYEKAYDLLWQTHWGAPLLDGGNGGTGGHDLYLIPGLGEEASGVGIDGDLWWSFLDAGTSFAMVDPAASRFEACVASAYAEQVLVSRDPAEAEGWRRATADFLAWLMTGEYGCGDAVSRRQAEPHVGWVANDLADGGGALFLTLLSDRHDRGSGNFINDLWQVLRQRTWDGVGYRGSPDMYEAIGVSVDLAGDKMNEAIEEFGVARWFTGDRRREVGAPKPVLMGLPEEARIPLMDTIRWDELPEHTPVSPNEIQPYGSAYVMVDVREAPVGSILRTWLRGEFGVLWSFVAVRLDGEGRELGRMTAPVRRTPRSYLVVEVFEGTEQVLLVATNLSARPLDADTPDQNARSFKMIVDRHQGFGEGAVPE
ncbi:MAG: hypothetical protein AAGF12_26685 [Myxococcota bacterium]